MDLTAPIFQYLGLTTKYENHCPTHPADVEGLIVLVQHKDRAVYGAHTCYLVC